MKNKKRVLVLGATGMLGHMVYNHLSSLNKYDVMKTTKNEIETTRDKFDCRIDATWQYWLIEQRLSLFEPDIIINCIGVINKYADINKEKTYTINSHFPHLLAYLSIKHNWKLIHISSDCYLDNDTYGKSKWMGEINDRKNLTIRTSIIGPELKDDGQGLFHWFMSQEKECQGYTDAKWDGTTTLQLAKFINQIIDTDITGIIDYRTRGHVTKYRLLNMIKSMFDKDIKIKENHKKMPDKRNFDPDMFCNVDIFTQLNELRDLIIGSSIKKYQKYF